MKTLAGRILLTVVSFACGMAAWRGWGTFHMASRSALTPPTAGLAGEAAGQFTVPGSVRQEWQEFMALATTPKTGLGRFKERLQAVCPPPLDPLLLFSEAAREALTVEPDATVAFILETPLSGDRKTILSRLVMETGTAATMITALGTLPPGREPECREWISRLGRELWSETSPSILSLASQAASMKPSGYEEFLLSAAGAVKEPSPAAELYTYFEKSDLPAALKSTLTWECLMKCEAGKKLDLALTGQSRPLSVEDLALDAGRTDPADAVRRLADSRWGRLDGHFLSFFLGESLKSVEPLSLLDAVSQSRRAGLKVAYTMALAEKLETLTASTAGRIVSSLSEADPSPSENLLALSARHSGQTALVEPLARWLAGQSSAEQQDFRVKLANRAPELARQLPP